MASDKVKKYRREWMSNWRKENKNTQKDYDAKYRNKPATRYSIYCRNANLRELEFDLNYEEFMTFWQKPCYYCGDEIETIGLDRRDNMIGYTPDNVVSCCKTCNYLKRNILDSEEFIGHCTKIANRKREDVMRIIKDGNEL